MSLTVTNTGGGSYHLIDAGMHPARCYAVVDLGTQESPYGTKQQILIMWELPEEKHVFTEEKGPESAVLSKFFTASLNEKANLTAALQSWRGKPFTEEELKGFDLHAVIKAPCLLNVIHKTNQSGEIRANIDSVAPAMKGQVVPEGDLEPVYYEIEDLAGGDYDKLPQWIKLKLNDSAEFKAEGVRFVPDEDGTTEAPTHTGTPDAKNPEVEDYIPF
jgi:hypothetical protein